MWSLDMCKQNNTKQNKNGSNKGRRNIGRPQSNEKEKQKEKIKMHLVNYAYKREETVNRNKCIRCYFLRRRERTVSIGNSEM